MTPGATGKQLCFATRRGVIRDRADFNYSYSTIAVNERYASPRYPLTTISELVELLQYGTSMPATEEEAGVPMLRMNNLQDDDWNLSDLKYIEMTANELELYRLEPGDILFNRTNSKELVGKCAVFRQSGDWVFASYLIRLRVNPKLADPDFVSAFLNTRAGRLQIDRLSRQIIGMANINSEEIRGMIVPLPNLDTQRELSARLENGRRYRRSRLTEAADLLAGVDDFLIKTLRVKRLPADAKDKTVFAAKLGEIRKTGRLNADYYHPEREQALAALGRGLGEPKQLSEVATFVRDITSVDDPDDYVGLANVQKDTGERVVASDDPGEGSAFRYESGDILFARLRPYLNKVHRAESPGICSTEFHVIRVNPAKSGKPTVLPDYLAAVLRSSHVVAQTRHMMTGNTHPRLANEDVTNLVIPVPPVGVQQAVVDELIRRREEARRLRELAAAEWDEAKAKFESELLG